MGENQRSIRGQTYFYSWLKFVIECNCASYGHGMVKQGLKVIVKVLKVATELWKSGRKSKVV